MSPSPPACRSSARVCRRADRDAPRVRRRRRTGPVQCSSGPPARRGGSQRRSPCRPCCRHLARAHRIERLLRPAHCLRTERPAPSAPQGAVRGTEPRGALAGARGSRAQDPDLVRRSRSDGTVAARPGDLPHVDHRALGATPKALTSSTSPDQGHAVVLLRLERSHPSWIPSSIRARPSADMVGTGQHVAPPWPASREPPPGRPARSPAVVP